MFKVRHLPNLTLRDLLLPIITLHQVAVETLTSCNYLTRHSYVLVKSAITCKGQILTSQVLPCHSSKWKEIQLFF